MATKPPRADIDEARVHVSGPKKVAVGVPAVLHGLQISVDQMGVGRSVQTLLRVTQRDGFDCTGARGPKRTSGTSRSSARTARRPSQRRRRSAG